jgi:hypothetical protein
MNSNGRRRIAVLGLYNSGSTALAGMLHRLGVNMGSPFWMNSGERDSENFYEPYDLSRQMRRWWIEPALIARVSAADRVGYFRDWMALQEWKCSGPVGAKHPLLSLCAAELATAWGADVCLLWSWRSFDESLAGLRRRGWFPEEFIAPLQKRLWDALCELDAAQHNLIKLDWNAVKSNPIEAARRLASLAGLEPTGEQLRSAAEFIRQPSESAGSQHYRTAA